MKEFTCKSPENQYLFQCFLSIKDPRVQGRCTYPLINILTITLCALICQCDNWESISLFAKKRHRWLSQFLDLSNGIPTAQTFARVFSLIDPDEFKRCVMLWIEQIAQLITFDIIAVDGKTLRGSGCNNQAKKTDHIINAYSPRLNTTLTEAKTPDKSNEIKGIPILLNKLNITHCVVTIDAMGTQKGIAKLIRENKRHYVLALKQNHKRFYRKVAGIFNQADQHGFAGMVHHTEEHSDYGHGRIEHREYTMLPMMYLEKYKKHWRGLSAFVRVKTTRQLSCGVTETAVRYYITSLPIKRHQKISEAIRSHWGIENSLHYKLDVGLCEDACPIYRGHAAENLATMRKLVLQLLEREKSSRYGIAMKRTEAALSTRYLRKVIGF